MSSPVWKVFLPIDWRDLRSSSVRRRASHPWPCWRIVELAEATLSRWETPGISRNTSQCHRWSFPTRESHRVWRGTFWSDSADNAVPTRASPSALDCLFSSTFSRIYAILALLRTLLRVFSATGMSTLTATPTSWPAHDKSPFPCCWSNDWGKSAVQFAHE